MCDVPQGTVLGLIFFKTTYLSLKVRAKSLVLQTIYNLNILR